MMINDAPKTYRNKNYDEWEVNPIENEVWINLTEHNLSRYDVSSFGYVRYSPTGRILKNQVNDNGTTFVTLVSDEDDRKTIQVGKLVLLAFDGEHPNSKFLYVMFRNNDRQDCRLANVDWVTKSKMIKYAKSYSRFEERHEAVLDSNIVEHISGVVYDDVLDASNYLGIEPNYIYHLAKGIHPEGMPHYNLDFQFIDE